MALSMITLATVRTMRVNLVQCGTGSPILFLHGIGSTSATWAQVMAHLEDRHTVAAMDLIGHGGSPVPDEPAEYARDRALEDIDDVLAELATQLPEQPLPLLVGHSLGGYLALAHAATRPTSTLGLVVLNTGPGFRDPQKREAWNAMSRRNAHRFGVVPQATELNLQADSVVMERLSQMQTPTLFLAGSEDRPDYTRSGQYLERKMPHCRFISIEGGEHAMHEESHASEVADIIANFASTVHAPE